MIKTFIAAGASVSEQDKNGWTPLIHAAAINANPASISILLKAGAEATIRDRWGRTAYDFAQNNKALKGTPEYWALSDARY
jgi:uncharacterized protein